MKWISVEKSLPPESVPVLAAYNGYCTRSHYCDMIAVLKKGVWHYYRGSYDYDDLCCLQITHWMPMPKLPREVRRIDREG